MKVVGIGCNCEVAEFIKKHFKEATYPFDWMWSNIEFVLKTFETDSFEYTACDKLNPVWESGQFHTYIFNNGCKGGKERICSAVSLHDADHHTYQQYVSSITTINDKYKRRFERLYNVLNSGEDIFLIRKVLDKDQGAIKSVLENSENLSSLANLLKKFKSRIIVCVMDKEGVLQNFSHPDIKVFPSFEEILSYIQKYQSHEHSLKDEMKYYLDYII